MRSVRRRSRSPSKLETRQIDGFAEGELANLDGFTRPSLPLGERVVRRVADRVRGIVPMVHNWYLARL